MFDMSDTSPLDGPPVDDLERAFRLPEDVRTDRDLSALYETMVARLRREAQGIPMNTIQQLLIERIASLYVQIKHKENTASFSANQQREFNSYWLDLTKEFNRLLQASDDKLREAMLAEMRDVLAETLEHISDPEERRTVRRNMAEALAALGQ